MNTLDISIELESLDELEETDALVIKLCDGGELVSSGCGFGARDYEFDFENSEKAKQAKKLIREIFRNRLSFLRVRCPIPNRG